MKLNTVLKSSSLNDWQQSTFAGYYWLQHTHELSSWAATESKDCTATLFTFLPIWFLSCCGCGLGFLVCLVFIRFFFGDWQEKNPFRNIFQLETLPWCFLSRLNLLFSSIHFSICSKFQTWIPISQEFMRSWSQHKWWWFLKDQNC